MGAGLHDVYVCDGCREREKEFGFRVVRVEAPLNCLGVIYIGVIDASFRDVVPSTSSPCHGCPSIVQRNCIGDIQHLKSSLAIR